MSRDIHEGRITQLRGRMKRAWASRPLVKAKQQRAARPMTKANRPVTCRRRTRLRFAHFVAHARAHLPPPRAVCACPRSPPCPSADATSKPSPGGDLHDPREKAGASFVSRTVRKD